MKSNLCAIDTTDYISLLAVWELQPECYWELLTITRLRNAIALVRESPLTRLVFPTGVSPNKVWGGVYKDRIAKINQKKEGSLPRSQERVLALLRNTPPGQTREALASQLGIGVATVGQLLRKLEKQNEIYYRPHPTDNKTKLYYVGKALTTTATSATFSTSKPAPRLRREPPLKVYFVDHQSIQKLNR